MGCGLKVSFEPEQESTEEVVDASVSLDVFDPVKRSLASMRAALDSGCDRAAFGERISEVATELSLLEGSLKSEEELEILALSKEALQVYKDIAVLWDARIETAKLKYEAERQRDDYGLIDGIGETWHRTSDFIEVCVVGIPLETYLTPKPISRGLDRIVSEYSIPIKVKKTEAQCSEMPYVDKDSHKWILATAEQKWKEVQSVLSGNPLPQSVPEVSTPPSPTSLKEAVQPESKPDDLARTEEANHHSPTLTPHDVQRERSQVAGGVSIRLSAGTTLAQNLPTGPAMGFSVDYELIGGQPDPSTKYFWVIEPSRGQAVRQPVQLKMRGTLQGFVQQLGPGDGPFKTHIAGADGSRLSPSLPLR